MNTGGDRGEPRSNIIKSGGPQKALEIESPEIKLSELKRLTDNFGTKALIGEGSNGRVFRAKLSTGEEAAIKKLDTGSSPDPESDSDFESQVYLYFFFLYLGLIIHRGNILAGWIVPI